MIKETHFSRTLLPIQRDNLRSDSDGHDSRLRRTVRGHRSRQSAGFAFAVIRAAADAGRTRPDACGLVGRKGRAGRANCAALDARASAALASRSSQGALTPSPTGIFTVKQRPPF